MEYYIYGAGNNLQSVLEQTNYYLDIEGIIDNNDEKINTVVQNLCVQSADYFLKNIFDKENHKIIVSVTQPIAQKEIQDDLKRRGLKKGCNYYMASDFCRFDCEQIPGAVQVMQETPEGYYARKSCDPNSYLVKSSTGRLFRIFKQCETDRIQEIYIKCKQNNMFGQYIVNSWYPDDIHCFGDSLVLEHEYIDPITYCFEWSPTVYEEYVKFMFDFVNRLSESGLKLADPHGLNATIHEGKFVFLDYGAIDEGQVYAREIVQLLETLVYPLILMKKGQIERAYLYLEEHEITMCYKDICGYLCEEEKKIVKEILKGLIGITSNKDVKYVVDEIKGFINHFGKVKEQCAWGDYQDDEWDRSSDPNRWTTKMKNVVNMIRKVKPMSIIDIAGNQGWYGSYCREIVNKVIVVDMDMNALDRLWERIKENNMQNVTPVKMSICAPSLGRHYDGLIDGNTIQPLRESGCNRVKCDMAIALAIVHHLVFREHLSFEEVVLLLMSYCKQYLIVEFVEQTDYYISNFKKQGYEWYTKNNFESILLNYFDVLQQCESSPEETRTLYLCKKR